MQTKMIIVMRSDLNMRKGKMIAQGSHASLGAIMQLMDMRFLDADNAVEYRLEVQNHTSLDHWLNDNLQTKIAVKVDSQEQLEEIYHQALLQKLNVYMVTDVGKTEFNGIPTKTCLAIGPHESSIIDAITSRLKLL